MTRTASIFRDTHAFEERFEHHLAEMLVPDALGAFILVLANSMQDHSLAQQLRAHLEQAWAALIEADCTGQLNGPPDDLAVFQKLAARGLDATMLWEFRELPPWRLVFNPLRALRPARASRDRFESLQRPFDPASFHFDKAFLRAEILSEEYIFGVNLRLMYHKFPFAPFHLLIVPEASAHKNQYLDRDTHALFWRLTEQIGARLDGWGLAYNSLGAGASINHLHAHSFLRSTPLPVELPQWQHNGGASAYPVGVICPSDCDTAWRTIEHLQSGNQPFNLLFRPGRTYILPRRPQGTENLAAWLASAGWYELSGEFNLYDRQLFDSLQADQITHNLATFMPPSQTS